MATHRNDFITWYFNEFRATELYGNMSKMVENSPWHRESDVGTHTDMVVAQYIARAANDTWMNDALNRLSMGRQYLLGAFAAAFHDVAKVKVVQYKNSEERGDYKAFNGHEKVSARMWEDWAVTNWPMLTFRFGFNRWDLYAVGWMIEHHLPWAVKDKRKRDNLALTALRCGIEDAFATLLMADTTGRISDDAETKVINSQTWVDGFHDYMRDLRSVMPVFYANVTPEPGDDQPRLVMPIGASGSGKTTVFTEDYQDEGYGHFSRDEMRFIWTMEQTVVPKDLDRKGQYKFVWNYCVTNEKEFTKHWQDDFRKATKRGVNLFVDGTNLSAKVRRFFLVEAENRGYWTRALLFPSALDTLVARQERRPDKFVPGRSVKQQYEAMALPQYGEFDEILIKEPGR